MRESYSAARTDIYRSGDYGRAGGCLPLPVPEDVPFYMKDYNEYYKGRAYHARSLNSNEGLEYHWNPVLPEPAYPPVHQRDLQRCAGHPW